MESVLGYYEKSFKKLVPGFLRKNALIPTKHQSITGLLACGHKISESKIDENE